MAFLPAGDRRYLEGRGLAFREIEDGVRKGVVLEAFPLPPDQFQVSEADVLIQLPPGYPDACPDMFWTAPHLVLAESGREPNCTQVRETFAGLQWQRWSRHSQDWRPGADGLRTMIKRIEQALKVAA
ncbi:E2/UBC family protein [Paracoccus sp. WLY502]|uniref:E2/UBC family protein n=1 Tax=Paracoccus yibinensis TaxID=3068891 RepID=UPI0027964B4A|nr:E2/UBC family protein [Paracoccus sp. WLY502]MDQ1902357.1 E2/UBC family protein [Paracoccus sp. WLY502]